MSCIGSTTLLCIFCALFVLIPGCDSVPLNLNVKSSFLSDLLQRDNEAGNSTRTSSRDYFLGLDLSGQLVCHVVGQDQKDEDDGTIPLLPLQTKNKWHPSLYVNTDWKLSDVCVGLTKFSAALRWKIQTSAPTRRMIPSGITLQAERGLLEDRDSGVEISSEWSHDPIREIRARWDPRGVTTLSLAAPLHKRLHLHFRSLWLAPKYPRKEGYFAFRIPLENPVDWWIPNVQINSLGRIVAKSHGVLRGNNMDARLAISHQLGWNAFGMNTMADEGTRVRLELNRLSNEADAISSIALQGYLDNLKDTSRVILTHERAHCLK